MNEPDVRLELAANAYRPGDELTGAFILIGGVSTEMHRVEFSVLWRTSGKGTEDMGVIHFQSWKRDDDTLASLPNPNTFAVRLPRTPWSYDGELIKIHWLARVRVRFGPTDRTHEVIQDTEFTLAPAGQS